MKKLPIYNLITNILLYTIAYLIKTFVIWKFTNPFTWIINMPNYNNEDRGLILFAIVFWQVIQVLVIYGILTDLQKKQINKTICN